QFAERQDRWRWLMLKLINPPGKSVGHLLDIAGVDKGREGERLLPEEVDHILKVIDPFLARHLVLFERILFVVEFPLEKLAHDRSGEFRFPHRHRYAEGKDRINETVRVTDADKPFPTEPAHLKRVIGNHVHLLSQVELRNAASYLGIDLIDLAPEVFLRRLFLLQKLRPWRHHSQADHFLVDRDEPSPVKFLIVKDEGIVLGLLP